MTVAVSTRAFVAAAASAVVLTLGPVSASAAVVQATIDFTGAPFFQSGPGSILEDGFEIRGSNLVATGGEGNPAPSLVLDLQTPSVTVTRIGGGTFSLVSFDYACRVGLCDFRVSREPFTGGERISTGGSASVFPFGTFSPSGPNFTEITSLAFSLRQFGSVDHRIDNIVLSFQTATAVPSPGALPLMVAGVAGLGLALRRKARTGMSAGVHAG